MKTIEQMREMPMLVAANDTPHAMTRAVREMLHALCRLTGAPYQPGQSQEMAIHQIERLRDTLDQQKNA